MEIVLDGLGLLLLLKDLMPDAKLSNPFGYSRYDITVTDNDTRFLVNLTPRQVRDLKKRLKIITIEQRYK
jgi:hypothetical protein